MSTVIKNKKNEVESFTISRRRHLRGTDLGLLRNDKGSMCCLGHFSRACGVDIKSMIGVGAFDSFSDDKIAKLPKQIRKLLIQKDINGHGYLISTVFADVMAEINDDGNISVEKREALIIHGFQKKGIKVSFTG